MRSDECVTDADCGEREFCEVRVTAQNTCEVIVDEPVSCEGSLIVWELSVTEDIPIGDGVLVNELQLGSVDLRAGAPDSTPPTEIELDGVPLPYAPTEPLRFPLMGGENFNVAIDVEHPEERFRTFSCGFSYEDMLASQGAIACALPVDGDTVLETDPIPTVYAKVSYDIPNECGVNTNQPGLLEIEEVRAFELIDHPETGPGTPRQYGTVDAVLTVNATKIEPRTLEEQIPFTPDETEDVPVDWDGFVSIEATLDLSAGSATLACTLDFSEALRLGVGSTSNDVSPDDPLIVSRGDGVIRCLDAADQTLMMEISYELAPLWQLSTP